MTKSEIAKQIHDWIKANYAYHDQHPEDEYVDGKMVAYRNVLRLLEVEE